MFHNRQVKVDDFLSRFKTNVYWGSKKTYDKKINFKNILNHIIDIFLYHDTYVKVNIFWIIEKTEVYLVTKTTSMTYVCFLKLLYMIFIDISVEYICEYICRIYIIADIQWNCKITCHE